MYQLQYARQRFGKLTALQGLTQHFADATA
jgi:hypothetical protein